MVCLNATEARVVYDMRMLLKSEWFMVCLNATLA